MESDTKEHVVDGEIIVGFIPTLQGNSIFKLEYQGIFKNYIRILCYSKNVSSTYKRILNIVFITDNILTRRTFTIRQKNSQPLISISFIRLLPSESFFQINDTSGMR